MVDAIACSGEAGQCGVVDLGADDRQHAVHGEQRIDGDVVGEQLHGGETAGVVELGQGGREMLTLNTGIADRPLAQPELEALADALESLQRIDERAHRVVEMRYFGGMEIEDVAAVLDVSPATVKRDWQKARAYLLQSLETPA